MHRIFLAIILNLILIPFVYAASVPPKFISAAIPGAALVGQGTLRYLMMDIYVARLYAPGGFVIEEKPIALSLTYLRDISGKQIADRTIEEIRDQGFADEVVLAAWHNTLREIFPDVKKGVTLTGVLRKDGSTVFYRDGIQIGAVPDTVFGRQFFSIWLSPKTRETELRKRLLNVSG